MRIIASILVAQLAAAAAEPLSYPCGFSETAPVTDGDLSDDCWKNVVWSADFSDIRGGDQPAPRFRTRMKMLWTADALHVAAELAEPHVWGTLREKNAIIFHDNDFEIFLDPDGDGLNYYEFEINALGTIWELTLDKAYSRGGSATHGTNLPGLRSGVKVQGTLNDPSDTDTSWTVEISIPWKDLAAYRDGKTTAPDRDDVWRINFSRVQWKHRIESGRYLRIPPHGTKIGDGDHPEDNWVWSPQGAINMHLPEKWGMLRFVD